MTIYLPKSLWIAVLALILVSCAPQIRTEKESPPGPSSGTVPVIAGDHAKPKIKPQSTIDVAIDAAKKGSAGAWSETMMDNHERDLRAALAKSKAIDIHRQGTLLAITLKGDVAFDTNSVAVRQGLYAEIERISTVLYKYPRTVVRVEGHTDSQGSESYNRDLSQRRAEAVTNIMVQLGIDSSRIEPAAYGESQPVATNDTEVGRMMNRRLEIKFAPAPNR